MRIFDIGANLTDAMFQGIYHGKTAHVPDLHSVLKRAREYGVEKIMVTAGCLADIHESKEILSEASKEFPGMLCTTIGVHPTRCNEFDSNSTYMEELISFAKVRKELNVKAIGEFGLDYDRIQFCPPDQQRFHFERQFILADVTGLPLFLHMRDACKDFIGIVKRNRHRFKEGVVHSFTGSLDEAKELLDLDVYIGINGCSLKTEDNLKVVKELPLNRIMVESDAPWCEIRPSHAGSKYIKTKPKAIAKEKNDGSTCVKSRNEPFACRQVLEVVAELHNLSVDDVAQQIFQNTFNIFG